MTVGLPIVNVPVLSNTIVFTIEKLSKTLPPRKSNPLVAPSDVPTFRSKGYLSDNYNIVNKTISIVTHGSIFRSQILPSQQLG